MLSDITGCAQNNQFIGNGNYILLETVIQGQIYFSAWDGGKWSPPQVQNSLSSFIDPQTQNTVNYGCQQIIVSGKDHLVAIGCDHSIGEDIWVTSRSLGPASDWFPVASEWSLPVLISHENCESHNPISLSSSDGSLSAFWVQKIENLASSTSSNQEYNIFTSLWDGKNWTTPTGILSQPIGPIYQLHAVVDVNKNIIVFWNTFDSGDIYFSQVSANRSAIQSEWSEPLKIPIPQHVYGSMDFFIGESGDISIAYSIPFNEERGIYFSQSSDGMQNWSAPVQIFNAAFAQWDTVDQPVISSTGGGHFQVIWTRYSLPVGSGSKGLYYSRSEDNGKTWIEPEIIADTPTVWSSIISVNDHVLHRLWQENTSGQPVIKDQISQDGGISWNSAIEISSLGNVSDPINITKAHSGELLLEQIIKQGSGNFILYNWRWTEDQWTEEDSFNLNLESGNIIDLIANTVTENDLYTIVYSTYQMDEINDIQKCSLYFVNKTLNISPSQASSSPILPTQTVNLESIEQTATSPETTAVTSTLEPQTQTLVTITPLSPEEINKERVTNNGTSGILLGTIMAVLTVSICLGIALLIIKSRR